VIDAYALTLAALLLTAGSIADMAGRRKVFAAGIVTFTLGSLLCGLSTGTLFLSLARAAQGVGGAIMFATALALIAQAFRGQERGVAFGIFGATTGLAVATGPVLGGALVSGLSWRWIFFVNIPVGVAALAVTLLRVDESRDPAARRIDVPGLVTFSSGLAALVFGLIRSGADGWGSTTVVASLSAAVALLGAFVVVERFGKEPMFDFSLLRVPTFDGGLLAAFGVSASMLSMFTFLVLYMQNLLGLSAFQAGVRFLPITCMSFVASAAAGRLTTLVPVRWLIAPGFALVGIGLLLMHGITPADDWTTLLPGMIVAGFGTGLINVPLASTAVGVVKPERAGMASGVNATFRQVGLAAGVATLGSVFASVIRGSIVDSLASTPLDGAQAHSIADAASHGHAAAAIASAPGGLHGAVAAAARSGFVDGLNTILLIAAITALRLVADQS
jgi:EmrB/QacA subfamily drug resistance transporter